MQLLVLGGLSASAVYWKEGVHSELHTVRHARQGAIHLRRLPPAFRDRRPVGCFVWALLLARPSSFVVALVFTVWPFCCGSCVYGVALQVQLVLCAVFVVLHSLFFALVKRLKIRMF